MLATLYISGYLEFPFSRALEKKSLVNHERFPGRKRLRKYTIQTVKQDWRGNELDWSWAQISSLILVCRSR